MLEKMLYGLIESEHGSCVADQFECTWRDFEDLEDQNENALEYIVDALEELIGAYVLSTDSEMELEDYIKRLKDYLKK